jgi:alkylated DNA repair protein (DNA oxidative demethylase)
MTPRPPRRTDWASLRIQRAAAKQRSQPTDGLLYEPNHLTAETRRELRDWLGTIHPIWEQRFSPHHPPPPGQEQRWLLRPVYWLGNWQFACLGYYHPPKGIHARAVQAEPFPPVLARIARTIEAKTRQLCEPRDVPRGWTLNTCLINFYGERIDAGGRRHDTARVGEHKDFEPGPVGSLSLGDRALFQFVSSSRPGARDAIEWQQWLEDGSLQIFAGPRWKERLFHRVQRVEDKRDEKFDLHLTDFDTRRINLTFRYVPAEHIVPYARLPQDDADDVRGYMETLARHSPFFAEALRARTGA